MTVAKETSPGRTFAVLHPVFAFTGVLHTVGGALIPSISARFQLTDSASGLLFLLYFAGSSVGAALCRGAYARLMVIGFASVVCSSIALAESPKSLLAPLFFLFGVTVGVPMSAVTLFVGRNFPERCAPILTLLNFSWSIGGLLSPLIASRILVHHDYRTAYLLFAALAFLASLACSLTLRDPRRPPASDGAGVSPHAVLPLVLLFALAAFLQVGAENTVTAWLPTYALRTAGSGVVLAAASTSFYWAGFLSSRGLSSLLLTRVDPMRVYVGAVTLGLGSALLLDFAPNLGLRNLAMFLLGISLAPTYPLVLSGFFTRTRDVSQSRWILFTAGFGGSVLPWVAGLVSTRTGSIRSGMFMLPLALTTMALLAPALRGAQKASGSPFGAP